VVLDALDADGLKGSVADVESDFGEIDAAGGQRGQQRRGEVESGGGRRDRPAVAREDGLVADAVCGEVVALDVRRQRHVSDRVDRLVHGRPVVGPQADHASAMESARDHLTM
jgi:hypothetical protein